MSDGLKMMALLVLAAAAALTFWLLGTDDRPAGFVSANSSNEVPAEDPVIEPRRQASIPERQVTEAGDGLVRDGKSAAETAPPEASAETIEVTIEVKILGLDDRPWPIDEGEARIRLLGDSRRRSVELKAGRIVVALAADQSMIWVERATLGTEHRLALLEDQVGLPRDEWADGSASVTLRLAPRVLLRALDASDRRELKELSLVRAIHADWTSVRSVDFSGAEVISRGDSPLVVDVTHFGTNSNYWLLAPEHAATLLHFAKDSEGARIVVMESGGDLEIAIEGDLSRVPEQLQPFLRIYHRRDAGANPRPDLNGGLILEQKLSEACRLRLDALPAGEVDLVVSSGERWSSNLELARQTVTIDPSTLARATLVVDASALRIDLAEISGRIIYPASQGLPSFATIRFETRAERRGHPTPEAWAGSSRNDAEPDTIRFTAVKLAPGPYRMSCEGETFDFDVPEGGRDDLVFKIPTRDQVELVIRVEGEERPIEHANVNWSSGDRIGSVTWDEVRKVHIFNPPTGELNLVVWFDKRYQDIVVVRGESQKRIEVVLPKSQAFSLELSCDGLVIPHDFSLPIEILDAEGKEIHMTGAHSNQKEVVRSLAKPGRYRIRVTKPPEGYRSRGAVEFELKPGVTTKVVVELEVER